MFGIMLQLLLLCPHTGNSHTGYDGPDAVRCLPLVHSRHKVCKAHRSGISAVGLEGYHVCDHELKRSTVLYVWSHTIVPGCLATIMAC